MPDNTDYLSILAEMFEQVRDDVDKSEGSLIWESLSATASEFEVVFQALRQYINNASIVTADREHLIKHGEDYYLKPYDPTYAVIEGTFECDEGVSIPIGSRFTADTIFYTVTEKVSETIYHLQCEEAGTIGNKNFGQLLPVFSLQGFRRAYISRLLIPGEDEEDTEAFRERIRRFLSGEAFGGNLLDYIDKVGAIAGVGDCKIIRCPRGEGTVDVILVDSNYNVATEELVKSVQDTLRPLNITIPPEIDNCGTGVVPIGHDVIVRSATGVDLKVNFQLIFDEGSSYEDVKDNVEQSIKDYIHSLIVNWGDSNNYADAAHKPYKDRFISIQINRIGSLLFDIEGIHDYVQGSIKINDETTDLDLNFDEIPVFKEAINDE